MSIDFSIIGGGPVGEQTRERVALAELRAILKPDAEMPALGGWAATPQTVLRLCTLVLRLGEDALIVECGSGASTVWMALACRRSGKGRIVALEHDQRFVESTRQDLVRHGHEEVAEVRLASLKQVDAAGEKYSWYDPRQWQDLANIDLLFVDGPPGDLARRSRFPAYPLLGSGLRDGAIVALDDIDRADEQEISKAWLAMASGPIVLREEERVSRTQFFRVERVGGPRH